jgi:hypothetical protein
LLQAINVKLALEVHPEDLDLIVQKYVDPSYGDLINYVAFAACVDPPEAAYHPYTLGF